MNTFILILIKLISIKMNLNKFLLIFKYQQDNFLKKLNGTLFEELLESQGDFRIFFQENKNKIQIFIGRLLEAILMIMFKFCQYLIIYKSYPIEKYIHDPHLINEVKALVPFAVGQVCRAIHPVCKHFHNGSVLTTNNSQVILKFFTNELGVHKINQNQLTMELSDTNEQKFSQPIQYFQDQASAMKLEFNKNLEKQNENLPHNLISYLQAGNDSTNFQQSIIQDLDFFAMAFLIKVLERKSALINELRSFNNKAEHNSGEIDEIYFQEYGWSGVHISLLDNALKHINAKFRLRGVNNDIIQDMHQIQDNFEKILINPLKQFLSKEKQNSTELDKNVLKELIQIVNKTDEDQIQQKVQQFLANSITQLKMDQSIAVQSKQEQSENPVDINPLHSTLDFDIDEQKILSLNQLVHNCIGFLASAIETREINLSNNQFVINLLCNPVFESNPEKFHEINNIILNLNRQKMDWIQQNN